MLCLEIKDPRGWREKHLTCMDMDYRLVFLRTLPSTLRFLGWPVDWLVEMEHGNDSSVSLNLKLFSRLCP